MPSGSQVDAPTPPIHASGAACLDIGWAVHIVDALNTNSFDVSPYFRIYR